MFAQTAEYTLKWANNIPATHPSTIRIREAANAIKKETNGKVEPDEVFSRVWPFLGVLLIALLIIVAIPWISTGFL